jgi:hypothetical protein
VNACVSHAHNLSVCALPRRTAIKINQEKLFTASINCATPELHPRAAFVHSGDRIKKDSRCAAASQINLSVATMRENKQTPTRRLPVQFINPTRERERLQRCCICVPLSCVIQNDAVANALMHALFSLHVGNKIFTQRIMHQERPSRHESEIKLGV